MLKTLMRRSRLSTSDTMLRATPGSARHPLHTEYTVLCTLSGVTGLQAAAKSFLCKIYAIMPILKHPLAAESVLWHCLDTAHQVSAVTINTRYKN